MAVGSRTDPYLGFRFLVEIEGLVAGGFSEVSGIQAEIETEDYQEGGVNGYVHKLPKGMKYPNLVLKRGITDTDALWKWYQSVVEPNARIERKPIRIILLDAQGEEKIGWRCLQAYPIKWTGPDLKGDASSVGIESLELVHCGIQRT
jgi:phage tail-like protein